MGARLDRTLDGVGVDGGEDLLGGRIGGHDHNLAGAGLGLVGGHLGDTNVDASGRAGRRVHIAQLQVKHKSSRVQ